MMKQRGNAIRTSYHKCKRFGFGTDDFVTPNEIDQYIPDDENTMQEFV